MEDTTNTIDLMEQQEQTSTALSATVAKINELHLQAGELSQKAKGFANDAVAVALECGKLLIEQKKQVGHGNWLAWVETNLSFQHATVSKYIALARKSKEIAEWEEKSNSQISTTGGNLQRAKAKSLRQAFYATGILPEPPKVDNGGVNKAPNHTKWIDGFIRWFENINTTNPIEQWSDTERSVVILDLDRLIRIRDELVDLQSQ